MMHDFLVNNREQLIARCEAKARLRASRGGTQEQLTKGVPLVLDRAIRVLKAEGRAPDGRSAASSGPAPADGPASSGPEDGAARHGPTLLLLGFTVDQVVHGHGDLRQAVTELAIERDVPLEVQTFLSLNRCLDNAMAESVAEFSAQRDIAWASRLATEASEEMGALVHDLRNALHTALLAVRALELAGMVVTGATGSVPKRSLDRMRNLMDTALPVARIGASRFCACTRHRAAIPEPEGRVHRA